jgi:4-hydroxy-2-oxoheptanedioate aldolase
MNAAGFDWLFLDLEHGSLSIETACEISVPPRLPASRRWCARTPWRARNGHARAGRGALGVVIHHVDTAEEAEEIADRLRYPRVNCAVGGGRRSSTPRPCRLARRPR